MDERTDAIRARLRSTHGRVLAAVDASADAVVANWPRRGVADRTRIVEPFRDELDARDVLTELPAVLEDLVETAGYELAASAVPAPPYVVVTSTGVVLRASLPPGRLVIALEPFAVDRTPAPTYRRRDRLEIDVRWA